MHLHRLQECDASAQQMSSNTTTLGNIQNGSCKVCKLTMQVENVECNELLCGQPIIVGQSLGKLAMMLCRVLSSLCTPSLFYYIFCLYLLQIHLKEKVGGHHRWSSYRWSSSSNKERNNLRTRCDPCTTDTLGRLDGSVWSPWRDFVIGRPP